MKKLAAVIVETRNLPNLVEIIQDKHMKFLPEDTQLIIFHSDDNYDILKQTFPDAGFSRLEIKSLRDYNEVLTNPVFWKQLEEYFRVLVFQADSEILRTGIEEFLEGDFDWVGAPWSFQEHGGNGGASLRNPRVMKEMCEMFTWEGENEDIFFCNKMHTFGGGKLAPREVCSRFSVEAVFQLGSFAAHGISKWLTPAECEQILNQYK